MFPLMYRYIHFIRICPYINLNDFCNNRLVFQGTRVAIKKVTIKKKLDVNNQLLWEIKQVCQIFNYTF
jgi:hypothetical protein